MGNTVGTVHFTDQLIAMIHVNSIKLSTVLLLVLFTCLFDKNYLLFQI